MTDTHDNTVAYSYSCDALPACWPSLISYNGVEIKLIRQAAAAVPAVQRATGKGLVDLRGFLKRVEVWVNGAKQRAYALRYEPVEAGIQRLTLVQTFGRDWTVAADGTVSSPSQSQLPPWTFVYKDAGTGVDAKIFDWSNVNTTTSYADFTGDAGRMCFRCGPRPGCLAA